MTLNVQWITLEEHFTSEAASKLDGIAPQQQWGEARGNKLSSLSESRIADMDSGNVGKQVVSHTPTRLPPSEDLCIKINKELHAATQAHPDRLVGFATLPMEEPIVAAKELRRTAEQLGFVGALVDAHANGIFYDQPQYDVLWETAQDLDVPIYVHPCFASDEMMRVNYRGNYPEDVAMGLGAFVFGWHVQTGLTFLRLFASGVFDRFPRLKIILGHMGETIPYMLHRQEGSTGRWTHLRRPLGEVWQNNVWVTTSGMFTTAPLACLLKVTPLDHVLYSVDYPFSDTETGKKFVEEIEREGLLTGKDLEGFVRGNAVKLLRLKD